jgi:hypothetical protein
MTFSRRTLLTGAATLAAGASGNAQDAPHAGHDHGAQPPPEPSREPAPAPASPRSGVSAPRGKGRVHKLNGRTLEWRKVDGL